MKCYNFRNQYEQRYDLLLLCRIFFKISLLIYFLFSRSSRVLPCPLWLHLWACPTPLRLPTRVTAYYLPNCPVLSVPDQFIPSVPGCYIPGFSVHSIPAHFVPNFTVHFLPGCFSALSTYKIANIFKFFSSDIRVQSLLRLCILSVADSANFIIRDIRKRAVSLGWSLWISGIPVQFWRVSVLHIPESNSFISRTVIPDYSLTAISVKFIRGIAIQCSISRHSIQCSPEFDVSGISKFFSGLSEFIPGVSVFNSGVSVFNSGISVFISGIAVFIFGISEYSCCSVPGVWIKFTGGISI